MQDAKEEVRAKLNIEDVIGEYVQLKRAGRNFRGLSPFSDEKTPSFYVSPEKHIWHDFSSSKGGDIFSFIMEVEGLDFRSSLEHLARKAGVDLTLYESNGSRELSKLKKRLYEAHNLAMNYFQQSLVSNEHAVGYVFKKRGLSKQIVQDFKIGYAPTSGDALVKFLLKKGFSRNEIDQSGLTNRFGGDLFKGRMMIPLMDTTGRIIGFTGRIIIDDEKAPKYLNTPQTILYDKSRHVFGLSQAKESIRAHDYAVIVEGNMDVISSHQVDVKQVVATAGTAMTESHLKALVRLTNQVRLAFDGDRAGIAATERAIPIAQSVGLDLSIISMPDDAKDPDELIKKDVNLWKKAIEGAEPVMDWILRQYSKREDLETAMGKRKFTTAALDIIGKIYDPIEQEHYLKEIAKISESSLDALNDKLHGMSNKKQSVVLKKPIKNSDDSALDPNSYQDNLLAIAMIDSSTHDLFITTKPEYFVNPDRQAIVKYLIEFGGKVVDSTPKELQNFDTYVKILLLKADARYADWNDQDRYFESARLLRQVTNEHRQKRKDVLTEELRNAETLGDDISASDIRTKLNNLIKEIQSGKR